MGSPPHVRGKAHSLRPAVASTRITPAYAGKSTLATAWELLHRDHPRVCGEKTYYQDSVYTTPGSPPHVRGKVGNRPGGQLPVGITPACAGKSSGHMQRFGTSGDHPRVCGEKCRCDHLMILVNGITPAYAGKSVGQLQALHGRRNHPRMCGEKLSLLLLSKTDRGSPPHVRGKETG